MKRFEALALLSAAGMLALSGCSLKDTATTPASSAASSPGIGEPPVAGASSSVTPVVEGSTPSAAPTTSTPATSARATSAPASRVPATKAPTTPATKAPTAPATKGATARGLPESFAGWMRVDVDDSLGYPSAGYSGDAGTLRLQLRPATSPKALVTAVTKGRYVPSDSTPCAAGARMNACAVSKGDRVVLISSATLETEELADLVRQVATTVG